MNRIANAWIRLDWLSKSLSLSSDCSIEGSSSILCLICSCMLTLLLTAALIGLSCGADWFLIILMLRLSALNRSFLLVFRLCTTGDGETLFYHEATSGLLFALVFFLFVQSLDRRYWRRYCKLTFYCFGP